MNFKETMETVARKKFDNEKELFKFAIEQWGMVCSWLKEKNMKHTTREEIENILSETENEDETLPLLERAMEYYCGTWDKCEGYKHAILETLQDQYDNHAGEQEPDDLDELSDILKGAI